MKLRLLIFLLLFSINGYSQPLVNLIDSFYSAYMYNLPISTPSQRASTLRLSTKESNAIAAYVGSTTYTNDTFLMATNWHLKHVADSVAGIVAGGTDSSVYATHLFVWSYAYPLTNPSGFISQVNNYYGTVIHSLNDIEVDTSKVLSTYKNTLNEKYTDTVGMSNRINTKLNTVDTSYLLQKRDTATLHTELTYKVNYTDTANMLLYYPDSVGIGILKSGKKIYIDSAIVPKWNDTATGQRRLISNYYLSTLSYLSGTVAIANGGTGQTSLITAPTASTIVGQDANKNYSTNNELLGYTTTATAGGTTTLTVGSTYHQEFTGTLTQTIVLPVASTLPLRFATEITNNSSGIITVKSSGGFTVTTITKTQSATTIRFRSVKNDTNTTANAWEWDMFVPASTATGCVLQSEGSNASAQWVNTPTVVSLSTGGAGFIGIGLAPTNVPGSIGGTVDFSQPFRGSGTYKVVTIYLNALNGTAPYTYPVAFTHTPVVELNSGLCFTAALASTYVTSISTTACTITGTTSTGLIILKGY